MKGFNINMLDVIMCAAAFTAAVIGAGFITGCEIYEYFIRYRPTDCAFILLAAALMGVLLYILLRCCSRNGIKNSAELFDWIGGAVSVMTQVIIYFLMLSVFSAMVAAGAELIVQYLNINIYISAAVFGVILAAASACGAKQLIAFSGAAGFAMFVLIIAVSVYMLTGAHVNTFSEHISGAAGSIKYAGYNILSGIPVITSIAQRNRSKRFSAATAAAAACMLGAVMICIYAVIVTYAGAGIHSSMPMLDAVRSCGSTLYNIYGAVTVTAIITTALANGYGIIERLSTYTAKPAAVAMLTAAAVPLSFTGFGVIVKYMYGLCGILGTALMIVMIKKTKNREKRRKTENI